MNIPDPWIRASGPGAAGQTVDVTAEVIGKRRSARDAAKNFLKNKSRSVKQSAVGQKIAEAAQNVGQSQFGQNVAQTISAFPGGGLALAENLALIGGGAALGYAALQQRKKQAEEQQAASNIAAQMIRY